MTSTVEESPPMTDEELLAILAACEPKPDPKLKVSFDPNAYRKAIQFVAGVCPRLKRVALAISTDESRYVLNGVAVEVTPSEVTLIATDGRRLHTTELARMDYDGPGRFGLSNARTTSNPPELSTKETRRDSQLSDKPSKHWRPRNG